MARPNWSRLLPRPLVIPTVIHLSTLAEVRALIDRHLPPQTRNKRTWQYVRKKLAEAAYGGGDMMDVTAALQIAPRNRRLRAASHRQQKCVGRQRRSGAGRRYSSEEREQGLCHAQLRSRSSSRQAAGIAGRRLDTRRRLGCYLVRADAAVVSECRAHGMLGQLTSAKAHTSV
jgi:hypothetical protein